MSGPFILLPLKPKNWQKSQLDSRQAFIQMQMNPAVLSVSAGQGRFAPFLPFILAPAAHFVFSEYQGVFSSPF